MPVGQPGRTTQPAAAHRTVHQLIEPGRAFHRPLAIRILGEGAGTLGAAAPEQRGLLPSREEGRMGKAS
jgi:hypothetical protein